MAAVVRQWLTMSTGMSGGEKHKHGEWIDEAYRNQEEQANDFVKQFPAYWGPRQKEHPDPYTLELLSVSCLFLGWFMWKAA